MVSKRLRGHLHCRPLSKNLGTLHQSTVVNTPMWGEFVLSLDWSENGEAVNSESGDRWRWWYWTGMSSKK